MNYIFAEILDAAGVPAGVFNLVNGDGPGVGVALASHPDIDMVSFTGSTRAGIEVAKMAAPTVKRVTQELGGKSPNIVFADANLDAAVDGAMLGLFLNQGQCCCAGSRLLVQDKVYDAMVEKLAERTQNRKLGDPFDAHTEQGPQIDKAQFDKILSYIDKGKAQGARCVSGGERFGDRARVEEPVAAGLEHGSWTYHRITDAPFRFR